jgi:hypothetical protein
VFQLVSLWPSRCAPGLLLSPGSADYKFFRILGHTSISVTVDLYCGYIPEEDEQITRRISEADS